MKQMIEVIPVEHLEKFRKAIEGDKYKAVYLLMMFSGLTWSEISRLCWDNIDMDNHLLEVGVGDAKRVIEVGEDIITALKERDTIVASDFDDLHPDLYRYVFHNPSKTSYLDFDYVKKSISGYASRIRRFDITTRNLKRAFCMYYLVFNDLDINKLLAVMGQPLPSIVNNYIEGSTLVQADSVKRILEYRDSPVIREIFAVKPVKA